MRLQPQDRSDTQKNKRIAYRVLRTNTYQSIFNPYLQCKGHAQNLDSFLNDQLNFTVQISTNLKVLFLGDSVSMMNSQTFQELVGTQNRTILRYTWGLHEGLHATTSMRGGGVVAGWRITGLMNPKNRINKPIQNVGGGRWFGADVQTLLNHSYYTNSSNNNNSKKIEQFDALILRIPHGWMSLDSIELGLLKASIETAQKQFGFKTVVLFTLPMINNVQTREQLLELRKKNAMISDFVDSYDMTSSNNTIPGVHQIVKLDFGNLVEELLQYNGRAMGYNLSSSSNHDDFLFDQCCSVNRGRFNRSIPLFCNSRVPTGSKTCQQNGWTIDGMHWCNENLNGRIGGGVACLLGCLYNSKDETTDHCAHQCNQKFMSLSPPAMSHHHQFDKPFPEESEVFSTIS